MEKMEKRAKRAERSKGGSGSLRKLAVVLVSGALLSIGGASTRNAEAGSAPSTSSARVETSSAAGLSVYYAEAERDILELQLD